MSVRADPSARRWCSGPRANFACASEHRDRAFESYTTASCRNYADEQARDSLVETIGRSSRSGLSARNGFVFARCRPLARRSARA